MSRRDNNAAPFLNMECDNRAKADVAAYEAQYRKIVERAIASLVPDSRSDSGATTQDSSSNDDSSTSKQGDGLSRKPSSAGSDTNLGSINHSIPKNIIPEPARQSTQPFSASQTAQDLLRALGANNYSQQDRAVIGQQQQHQQQRDHSKYSQPGNRSSSQSQSGQSDSSGYSRWQPQAENNQRPDSKPPGQLVNVSNFLQALSQPTAAPAPQTNPDVLAGLQLVLQLLPLLQNQDSSQRREPGQQQQQNQTQPQFLPGEQQGSQESPQNAIVTQLVRQLLQSQGDPSKAQAAQPGQAFANNSQSPVPDSDNRQAESSGGNDLQNLLLQNLLIKCLSNQGQSAGQEQPSNQGQGYNTLSESQGRASSAQAAPAAAANWAPAINPPEEFSMPESTEQSEEALKNLLQMISLVMAPSGAPNGDANDTQPMMYESNGSNRTLQPNSLQPTAGFADRRAHTTSSRMGSSSAMFRDPNPNAANGSQQESRGIPIFMDYDEEALTEYQCLLRKQIELFEATQEDVNASAQGRNNPILLGQVGIRCRYCASLPIKSRPRGAVYYSRTIGGIYQVGQNMAKLHFCRTCKMIPEDVRSKLKYLQAVNRRASGGKEYWSEGLRVLGVYEDGDVMRLRTPPS